VDTVQRKQNTTRG